jgi:hypothetical protein
MPVTPRKPTQLSSQRSVAVGNVIKIERCTHDGSLFVVHCEKIGYPESAAFTNNLRLYLDTPEGKNYFSAKNFDNYVNPCYRRISRNDNKTIVGSMDNSKTPPASYPWSCFVFSHSSPKETHDAAVETLYVLIQDFFKHDDKKSDDKWASLAKNRAKNGVKLNKVYPVFDASVHNLSRTKGGFRPLDHVITDNYVAEHLKKMYGNDAAVEGDLDPNLNTDLYATVTKEDPDLMDGFFSRKDMVFDYTSLAIQEFGYPSGNLNESIKLKSEILSPVEEAQCEKLGKAFYASNKRKFISEEEAIDKMKSDALQNKRAKTTLAKQSTMEDFFLAEIVISPCASKHTDTSSVTPGHDGSIKDTKPSELPAGAAGETYKADGFELSGDVDDEERKLPAKENDEVEAKKGLKSPGRRKRVKL